MVLFFSRDRVLVRSFLRLGLSMGFSKLEFHGQIASFERRLRGAAPTPLSPCLIRSAPRRERGWGLSETSENCAIVLNFERYFPAFLRILVHEEVDKIKYGKTWFPNWCHILSQSYIYSKISPWYCVRYHSSALIC